jgi:hypothetical protein
MLTTGWTLRRCACDPATEGRPAMRTSTGSWT